MDEPALNLEGVALSPRKEMVRVFYKELWDHADKSLIPTIFHADFTFGGSLGPALIGHEQFAGYVDWVTGAFGQYTTDILVLIEEGNRVGGKMRFHGFHRKDQRGASESGPVLFPSRVSESPHLSTRQYSRIVGSWVESIGLDPAAYRTHSMREHQTHAIVPV